MKTLWIGMFEAEVTESCRHFGHAAYAGTNAVALAASEEEFVARVWAELERIGLRRRGCEDIERYEDRIAEYEVDQSIRSAAERARDGAVEFGTFHVTDER